VKKVLYVFYAASFMLGVVGGAYYTVSRDIVYKHVGLDYVFMSLLIASETVPGFFSVVGGMVGDVIGRRRMLLLGALSSIPLALIGFTSVEFIPLLILVYGVATSMAQPSIIRGPPPLYQLLWLSLLVNGCLKLPWMGGWRSPRRIHG
jgi:MFS family permease